MYIFKSKNQNLKIIISCSQVKTDFENQVVKRHFLVMCLEIYDTRLHLKIVSNFLATQTTISFVFKAINSLIINIDINTNSLLSNPNIHLCCDLVSLIL